MVGRAQELASIRELILEQGVRLLTLTGPGGVGKTRLALTAAGCLEAEFADGARFVDLAPISDPALVPSAIGRACGLIHDNVQAPLSPLRRALRDRELLLLIDNFEHVVEAAVDLGELVEACPRLRLLVTSREPLRLRSEWELPVQPLPLPRMPSPDRSMSREELDAVAANPSVALFVQRARAVRPNFALSDDNARTLAEVCIRLDGLPLAIELAAARTRFVPANAVALRLERALDLQSGLRDVPERHRTLRQAIDWSYALLSSEQQGTFTRLAVFAGGCSLEAAQAVCRPDDLRDDVAATFEILADLVARNLLLSEEQADGEVRFRLLETVREFALERLAASGHAEAARAAHAAYFDGLVGQVVPRLGGSGQRRWLEALTHDLDNLRAALRWLIGQNDQASLHRAAELNWLLWPFWWARGYLSEARRWSQAILDQPATAEMDRARAAWVASTAALDEGDYDAAPALVAECLDTFRRSEDEHALARALLAEGWAAPIRGDLSRAIDAHQESTERFESAGDQMGVSLALAGMANTCMLMGELDAAEHYNTRALLVARRMGDIHGQAQVLEALAHVALERGDRSRASATFKQSVDLCLEVGSLELFCYCLTGLAGVALREGALEHSARLMGAADGLRERAGLGVWPVRKDVEQRRADALRAAFAHRPDALERALSEGRGLALRDAVALVRRPGTPAALGRERQHAGAVDGVPVRGAASDVPHETELTLRERQVALLIAQGKTSKEIAEALIIAERTADTHAAHIRDKLGLRSRAEIAAWASRQGLTAPPT